MPEFLTSPLAKALIAVAMLVLLVRLAIKLFVKPKADAMHLKVRCKKCGWRGMVGKYNRRCYSCNGTDLIIGKS